MPGRQAQGQRFTAATLAACAVVAGLAIPAGASAATETVTASKSKSVGGELEAIASKKVSKKKLVVNTKSTGVAFSAGTAVGNSASCTGKTHLTGGGYAVSPGLSGFSGIRSLTMTSFPSDPKTWTAGSFSFTLPAASGTQTTYARCEGNALGKVVGTLSGTLSLPHSTGGELVLNCAPGTHAISGGFVGDAPNSNTQFDGAGANDGLGFRIIVLQSRRTGPGQWTVSAYNRADDNPMAPAAPLPPTSNVTGYVVCEQDGKRKTVSEVSTLAAIGDNTRSAADAACTGKNHTVSGGFLVTPATFPGNVPVVGVDESAPVDKQGWHTGLWESPQHVLPAGSSLQSYAYCKKDAKKQKTEKK